MINLTKCHRMFFNFHVLGNVQAFCDYYQLSCETALETGKQVEIFLILTFFKAIVTHCKDQLK